MRHLEVVRFGVVVVVSRKGCAVKDVFITAVRTGFDDAIPSDAQSPGEGEIPVRRGEGGGRPGVTGVGIIQPCAIGIPLQLHRHFQRRAATGGQEVFVQLLTGHAKRLFIGGIAVFSHRNGKVIHRPVDDAVLARGPCYALDGLIRASGRCLRRIERPCRRLRCGLLPCLLLDIEGVVKNLGRLAFLILEVQNHPIAARGAVIARGCADFHQQRTGIAVARIIRPEDILRYALAVVLSIGILQRLEVECLGGGPRGKVRLSRQVIVQTCGHGIQQGYALAIRMHQIQAEGGIAKRRIFLHPLAVLIHRAGPFGDAHRGEHAAPPAGNREVLDVFPRHAVVLINKHVLAERLRIFDRRRSVGIAGALARDQGNLILRVDPGAGAAGPFHQPVDHMVVYLEDIGGEPSVLPLARSVVQRTGRVAAHKGVLRKIVIVKDERAGRGALRKHLHVQVKFRVVDDLFMIRLRARRISLCVRIVDIYKLFDLQLRPMLHVGQRPGLHQDGMAFVGRLGHIIIRFQILRHQSFRWGLGKIRGKIRFPV